MKIRLWRRRPWRPPPLGELTMQGRMLMLRRSSQFAAIVLIIAVVAMPAMACIVPDRQMTAEEQACCKKMAHACESSAMPASHSCCQHPVSRNAVNVSSIRTDHFAVSAAVVEAVFTPTTPASQQLVMKFESPPEGPLKISSVLRI
jgi:hypothetical protein